MLNLPLILNVSTRHKLKLIPSHLQTLGDNVRDKLKELRTNVKNLWNGVKHWQDK